MGLMGVFTAILAIVCAVAWPAVRPQQAPPPAVAPAAPPSPRAQALLAKARMLPPDVTIFVHVDDAARMRRNIASRPIARWLQTFVGDGAAAKSWAGLARDLQCDQAELFDACFGQSVTFASRPAGQWVIVSDVSAGGGDRVRDLLRRLQVRAREARFGLAVTELPEQDVLLATDGDHVAIGPAHQPQLFFEALQRLDLADDDLKPDQRQPAAAPRLALLTDDREFNERLNDLQCEMWRARLAAFVRHARPLGGCSMIVADLHGDQVSLKHAARFDNAPFASPTTKLECDFSPVNLFADRALLAIMQPRDVGDGPVENFLSAQLGLGLLSPEMRQSLADRRMLVVGEHDARQLPEPQDVLTTTFVLCLEMKDASPEGARAAASQLDAQMSRLAAGCERLGQGAFLVRMPDCSTMRPDEARRADLGAGAELFTGGFPVMKTVSLNWAVARAPENGSAWFVVGSNPSALKETIEALRQPCPRDGKLAGRFDSCGLANGFRIGRHVQSWRDDAASFADPQRVDEVRNTLQSLGDLANGLQICKWQLARPTANTMRLEVQVTLAPAETAPQR